MRKTTIAAVLTLLLAAPAWAGGIGGMVSFWSSDEADDDTALGLKLELDLGQRVDFEVRAAFFDGFEFPEGAPAFELEAVPVDVGLGYEFSGRRFTPYLGAGLSYVLFNSDLRPQAPNERLEDRGRIKDEVGWYAVAGFEAGGGRAFSFFAEAIYRGVEAEIQGDDLQSFQSISVDFSGPAANVGLIFGW